MKGGRQEIRFLLNDREIASDLPGGTVLLDFIRDRQRLIGTRGGCREGDCGACTVLVGEFEADRLKYRAVASCLFPLAEAAGCHVVTIEGLNGDDLNPLQRAFVVEGASQCGFCTPGFLLSLTAFLLEDGDLQMEDALSALEGNVCRCTGYLSIRRALSRILDELRPKLLQSRGERRRLLVESGVLPAYFADVSGKLRGLNAPRTEQSASVTAALLAGGTDLYVQRAGELQGGELERLRQRTELKGILQQDNRIDIGAVTTVSELMESPVIRNLLPDLSTALKLVSSTQIRNRATLGGNIVNASPIGDLSVMMLALDARLKLASAETDRELKLRDFFLAYKRLDLGKEEILKRIEIPLTPCRPLFHFEKGSRRRHQDIASVCSAISLHMDGTRIAKAHVSAGGVAPIPLYLKEASLFLRGRIPDKAMLKECLRLAEGEIAPIDDMRGSREYKRILMRRLLIAHFVSLFPDMEFSGGDL